MSEPRDLDMEQPWVPAVHIRPAEGFEIILVEPGRAGAEEKFLTFADGGRLYDRVGVQILCDRAEKRIRCTLRICEDGALQLVPDDPRQPTLEIRPW